ncbi:MAG: 2-aminoethylphosphonate aminotransferase [Pseudomonadota bacterium]|nr:2-aminoethylphosphonate aminotransferase [Pseudomonadota bacterium]
MILLNPGPVTLSPRVRAALMNPDLCHREPEFADLQDDIRARLLGVYGLAPEDYAVVLLTGSGTAAVEAMLTSLIPQTGELLVLENGVYGERLTRIAEIHRIPHVRVQHAWRAPLDLPRIAETIERHSGLSHIAMVHHETTTGRLNALAEIGALGRVHGLGVLLDAVSSFGAEALDFEGLGLSACAATANKCLHGVPGVSFVAVSRAALSHPDGPRRSLYLDLRSYCESQDRRSTPYTPSVQVFSALREALAELAEEGGWQARSGRYRHLLGIARDGLRALGIEPLFPREDCSVVLNAFQLPHGMGYTELHDRLKDRGFIIYAGQGDLATTLFRVSAMGAIAVADMERFVDAVRGAISPPLPRSRPA